MKRIFFSITLFAMLFTSCGLFAQADVQAGAINLLAKFSGEEIVLQSCDYSFDTKYGRVRVKLGKSAKSSDAQLVLTPPLEGDTGSMAKQADALVSALGDSLGDSGNKDVLDAVSKVLADGVGDADGAEGDVILDIVSSVDKEDNTTVSIKFTGDDKTVEADLVIKANPDGTTSVSGETKTGSGDAGNTSKVDLVVKDGSSSGTIGGKDVSQLPSEKVETTLKEASITDTRSDGSTKKTDYVNNPDGTSTTTTTEEDSTGKTTSSSTVKSDSNVSANDVAKNTNASADNKSGGQEASAGGSNSAGAGGDSGGAQLPDNTIIITEETTLDYSGKDISGQDLSDKTFSGVKFRSTKAVGTNFENSQLDKTDFNSANLTNANLKNTNASYADFTNAILANANATNANFGGANLKGADLNGLTVSGANFAGSNLTKEQFYSTRDYGDGIIRGLNISGLDVSGWNFNGKTVSDMNAQKVSASVADKNGIFALGFAEGANVGNLNLAGSQISKTQGATSIGLFLSRSNIDGITLDNASVYSQAENEAYALAMAGADIKNLSAKNATFVSDNTSALNSYDKQTQSCAITMYKGKLTNADFSGSSVIATGVNDSTSADSTVFIGANFGGSTLENVNFGNTVIEVSASNGLGSGDIISRGINLADTQLNNGSKSGYAFCANNAKIYTSAENSNGSAEAYGIDLSNKSGDGIILADGIEIYTETNAKNGAYSYGLSVVGNDIVNASFTGAKINVSSVSESETAGAYGFYTDESIINSNFATAEFTATSNSNYHAQSNGFAVRNKDITDCDFSGAVFKTSAVGKDYLAQSSAFYSGRNITNTDFRNATFYATSESQDESWANGFYLTTNLGATISNVDFSGASFTAISTGVSGGANGLYCDSYSYNGNIMTFKNVNFQNVSVKVIENSKDVSDTKGMDFNGAILERVDFRGSNVSDYCVNTASSLTNVLYADGRIRNFSASNSATSIDIIAHRPKAGQSAVSAKIYYDNAVVSNAKLKLLEDAQLEVLNGKSLTLSENGGIHIVVNPDSGIVPISFSEGASFVLDGGYIIVDITQLPQSEFGFTIMEWTDDCNMSSLADLEKDFNITLCLNDKPYTGQWDFYLEENSLEIRFSTVVPEPAETAAILAFAALLAAAFLRHRK